VIRVGFSRYKIPIEVNRVAADPVGFFSLFSVAIPFFEHFCLLFVFAAV